MFDKEYSACETEDEIACQEEVFTKNVLSSDFIEEKCLKFCPLECNKTSFKYTLSSTQLTGDLLSDYINENPNLLNDFKNESVSRETAKISVISLNIFYDSLSYTNITESPKINLISLLAYVGGILGLFLGVSVFSIFELIEVIIEIFYLKSNLTKVQKFENNLIK